MDFQKVLDALLAEFKKHDVEAALIGGLALLIAGVERKTNDIDFMVRLSDAEKVDRIMKSLGYECLYKTENVANYHGLSGLGQVDFLFAHRKYGLEMMKRAESHSFQGQSLKSLRSEDLVGLKVQSSSSDPDRAEQDMLDVRNILRLHAKDLDIDLIREYFQLFKREKELDEILKKIR